jgi:hypothetical protein
MAKVTVFAFISPDSVNEDGQPPPHIKATREAIAKMRGATLIESSAEEIEESKLDSTGRYRPGK